MSPAKLPQFFNASDAFKRLNPQLFTHSGRGGHNKKDRGSATCAGCGSVFPLKTNSGKGKYCSQSCAAAAIGRKTIGENRIKVERTKYRERSCPACQKTFNAWDSANRKYCSIKCAANDEQFQDKRTRTFNAISDKSKLNSRSKKGWVEAGGKRFFSRSSWEANYGLFLQFQKEQGLIEEWEHEPETFWFPSIKRGCRSYLPDFRVTTRDGVSYHEVKGWMDSRSKTKLKRMAKYHPTVKIELIDSKRYRALARTARGVVKGWI